MRDVRFLVEILAAAAIGGASLLLCACPPKSTAPVVNMVDADGAAVPVSPTTACANLARLGCGVAVDGGSCVAGLTNISNEGMSPLDLGCISLAPTKSAIVQCAGMSSSGCP